MGAAGVAVAEPPSVGLFDTYTAVEIQYPEVNDMATTETKTLGNPWSVI
jgi:hypothetical protein